MSIDRAASIGIESVEYGEPYEDDDSDSSSERINLQPSVTFSYDGPDRLIKDANGMVYLLKDGRKYETIKYSEQGKSVPRAHATLESVVQAYEEQVALWKQSSLCAETISFVKNISHEVRNLFLTSCVCVGMGVFAGEHPYCTGGPSFDQLPAFEAILDVLRISHSITNVFVQDPVMSPLDCAFIESRGFVVVEDPKAQNLVTPNSLVYAPGCEWNVTEKIFELAYPAMYIGSKLERALDCVSFDGFQESEEVKQKLMERERFKFERVYRPSFTTRKAREIVVGPDGSTERMYWKENAGD